jgi:hypothetical protein
MSVANSRGNKRVGFMFMLHAGKVTEIRPNMEHQSAKLEFQAGYRSAQVGL